MNGDGMPRGWGVFRRIVTFLLGVAVILDSLIEKDTATVGKLVVGLLLVGVPSIDDLARLAGQRAARRALMLGGPADPPGDEPGP